MQLPFFKNRLRPPEDTRQPVGSAVWVSPQSGKALLNTPYRQSLLAALWQRSAVSRSAFHQIYLAPIERYAELVQLFPVPGMASHSYSGGMLDWGLEVAVCALRLRCGYLLPQNATPEEQAQQSEAWSAAVVYAALVAELGRLAMESHIEDSDHQKWLPSCGTIQKPYCFKYIGTEAPEFNAAARCLAGLTIPGADLQCWLAGFPELWRQMVYFLSGHKKGYIDEIVRCAIAEAGARSVCQPSPRSSDTITSESDGTTDWLALLQRIVGKVAAQRMINVPGSGYWLKDNVLWLEVATISKAMRTTLLNEGKSVPSNTTLLIKHLEAAKALVVTPEGRAVWRITVAGDVQQRSYSCLRVTPAVVGLTLADERCGEKITIVEDDGAAKNIPTERNFRNTIPVTMLPETATPVAGASETRQQQATTLPASAFVEWLKNALSERSLSINDTNSKVHIVNGKVLIVSPDIFRRYCLEQEASTGDPDAWKRVQSAFEKLEWHEKRHDGSNIWSCAVTGPLKIGKPVKGYLIDPRLFFKAVPLDSPFLRLDDKCRSA